MTWTGISWRQLEPGDPLAGIRSITRWAGGFVAVGAATRETVRTPVWTSTDGRTWILLDAAILGPSAIVVGVGESDDGLVALTVESGTNVCDASSGPCWIMRGPVDAWTSPDGRSWTSHVGPEIAIPDSVGVYSEVQVLSAGLTLAVTLNGQPVATSRDGIAWEPVSLDALPTGWDGQAAVAMPSSFLVAGTLSTETVALSSADGRVWSSHLIQGATAGIERVVNRIVRGADGLIVMGEEYQIATDGGTASARAPAIWWSSLDGRAWSTLVKYPPLGPMRGPDAQECFDACPDGILVGNGERMLAYRGSGDPLGWTSFDGRSWQRLVFEGSLPPPELSPYLSPLVLPIGILLQGFDGSTWFGTPIP